jgi:hypothetical protein
MQSCGVGPIGTGIPIRPKSVSNGRLYHMPNEDHAEDERNRQREAHAER